MSDARECTPPEDPADVRLTLSSRLASGAWWVVLLTPGTQLAAAAVQRWCQKDEPPALCDLLVADGPGFRLAVLCAPMASCPASSLAATLVKEGVLVWPVPDDHRRLLVLVARDNDLARGRRALTTLRTWIEGGRP